MEVKTARNLVVAIGLAMSLAILGMIMTGPAHAGGGAGGGGGGGAECDDIDPSKLITDDSDVPSGTLIVTAGEWCIGAETDPEDETDFNILHFDIKVLDGGILAIGAKNRFVKLDGNVKVEDGGKLIVRKTILGNINAKASATIELKLKTRVGGNVHHMGKKGGSPAGWIDFQGGANADLPEATIISGNLDLKGGALLKASGPSEKNVVEGHIKCSKGSKVEGGTATNWDGLDEVEDEDGEIVETGEDDGTIGKKYKCAA